MNVKRKVRVLRSYLFCIVFMSGVLGVAGCQQVEKQTIQSDIDFSDRTELAIAEDVRERIENHPGVLEENIVVRADNHKIILSGTVTQYSDIALAEDIADDVFGVLRVKNKLEVEPKEETISGEALADRIRELLERDPILSVYDIDVRVFTRFVILEGTVESLWEKKYASRKIGDVSGISKLDNELAVVPTEDITDEIIAEELQQAIDIATSADAGNVTITVTDGIVKLKGTVDTIESKNKIEEQAQSIKGVKAVINNLKVDHLLISEPKALDIHPDDASIRERVKRLLAHDMIIEESDITVTVDDGVVTLYGTVDSFIEKNEAVDNAYSVYGVEKVNDELTVDSGYLEEDTLAEKVREALKNRSSIDPPDFHIEVDNRKVTVTGSVESLWEKENATRIIESVIGVSKVENLLAVVPEDEVEDEVLAQNVVESLENNSNLDPGQITVRVNDGVVTLSGSVDSFDELRAAENAVEDVIGVLDIENELIIR